MDPSVFWIAINFFTCAMGAFMCACRMAKMNKRTKFPIRAQYSAWFALFVASGFSHWYGQPATFIQWFMGAVIVTHLIVGAVAWREGPPSYAVKQ